MKKILFIHPFLSYPLTSGGHQALFNSIMAVKDDAEITLIYEAIDDEKHREAQHAFLQRMPNVRLLPLLYQPMPQPTTEERIRGKIRNLYRKIFRIKDAVLPPNDITHIWKDYVVPNNRKWVDYIYKASREQHYDIIQIEMPWRIPDIYVMPKNSKVIHVHHELGFVRRNQEMLNEGETPYLQACRRFVDTNEIIQLNMYDAVITLSPIDKKKLEDQGVKIPIFSSFATVNTDEKLIAGIRKPKKLVFVGPGWHTPNLVGVKWFLKNCWNRLLELDSDYSLDIIGDWPDYLQSDLLAKYTNISFLGFVDDLFATIEGCVMIVPITIGSGIRMKILEACRMRIPFVSTPTGAEGIPVKDGEHCFLADDPETFVKDILKLQDSLLCERLCNNALDMVVNEYSLEALKKNRLSIYEDLLKKE